MRLRRLLINPTKPSTGETDHPALIRPVIAERYRELGEGVVCGLQTGLYWLVKPLGCESEPARYPWVEALQAAEAFNRAGGAAGYQDWRLPHRGPLKTLLDRPQRPSAFPGVRAGHCWTASLQDQPRYAWFVDFDAGQTGSLSKEAGSSPPDTQRRAAIYRRSASNNSCTARVMDSKASAGAVTG